MAAYYNENDPKAAAWLRELIKAGLIAAGDVDERSIKEVSGKDVEGYTQCHWFAGVAGWPIAFRIAGWPDECSVWSGSCPCQPLSCAGARGGETDERHLWPEFYRLIAERRPDRIFGEQVASKDGLEWLDGVCLDLEEIDYAVGTCDLPAACKGAPHIRQRTWWVAESANCRYWGPASATAEVKWMEYIAGAFNEFCAAICDSDRFEYDGHDGIRKVKA